MSKRYFSLEKFIEDCKKREQPEREINTSVYLWAKDCDGMEVEDGQMSCGLMSDPLWEIEKDE